MSIKVMNRVWEHSKAAGTPLLVLLCLADWANDDGECWPSISTIGRKCRLKDNRHVKRVIRELEKINEVVVVIEGGKAGSKGGVKSNLYTITVHMPAEPTVVDRPPSAESDGGRETPQTVVDRPPQTVVDRPPEPSGEPSLNPLAPTAVDASEGEALRANVIQACGLDPDKITSSAAGALSKAIRDLETSGARPGEVQSAANSFRSRFPSATLTPLALAKHWPALFESPSQVAGGRPSTPWYERIGIVTGRTTADPSQARVEIEAELGPESEFIELAMLAWERTRDQESASVPP